MLMSYAIAGGKPLEPWGSGSGMPVAYLDGEMRAIGFQSRLRLLHARNQDPESIRKVQQNLHIISRDFAKDVIGSIDQVEGQRRIDALIPDEVKLIVIDNLSAWTSGGREDGGSWATIKSWLIEKRLQGKSVLLVHHTGKNGKQRGSSAHEDLLDYSILLSPMASNGEEQDTRFTVEHTKLRDHLPHLKQRYEFAIYTKDNKLFFDVAPAGVRISEHAQEMFEMHTNNIPMSEIAEKFKVNKSTVSRTIQRLKAATSGQEIEVAVA
jgi:putative DNA primase/helicase